MWDFISAQSDYILFLHGLALIVTASIGIGLLRLRADRLAWLWMLLFALARGVHVWLGLLPTHSRSLAAVSLTGVLLECVSVLALFEFVRGSLARRNRRLHPVMFHGGVALLLAGSCWFDGMASYGACQSLLGLVATLTAAWVMASECAGVPRPARPWLGAAATAMLALALGQGLSVLVLSRHGLGLAVGEDVLSLRQLMMHAVMILPLAALGWSLLAYSVAMLARPQVSLRPVHLRPWRPIAIVSLTLLAAVAGGWLATEARARRVDEDFRRTSMQHLANEVHDLRRRLNEVQHVAVVLSSSPGVIQALERATPESLATVNQVLDRYQQGMDVSVSYLLNAQGKCVASSNRNSPQSFVGTDYQFRPYTVRSLRGETNTYFALGTRSNTRGMYAATPVRAAHGEIIGATVIKRDVTDLAADPQHERCLFFVDPHGIIFLSSNTNLALRSLWPLPPDIEARITKSRQFGDGPFPPLLAKEVNHGDLVNFHDTSRLVLMEPVGPEGWRLVMLASRDAVADARRAVISMFLFLTLLILGFSAALREAQVARAEVEASQRQYETLIEGSPNLVCLLDAQGHIAHINQAGLKALRRPRVNVLGQPFANLWLPESAQAIHGHLLSALAGMAQNCDGQLTNAGMTTSIWSISLTPIAHPQRGVCGLVAICNDVTERQLAHRAVHNHAELLGNVLNHIPSYVFWKDRDLVYQGCNSQFAKIAGLARSEDILGKTDFDLPWKPEEAASYREWDQRVIATNRPILNLEESQQTADGQQVCVLTSKVPLRDETGQIIGVLGIYSDITERKRQELAERERLSLRESITAMQNALGVVGHELRTPLTGLHAMTEYLLTDQQHHPETRQFLTSIHNEVLRLAEMVNNLLEAARLNSGVSRWKWSEFSLDTVCQDALFVLRPLIDAAQVRLTCQIEPHNLTMRGDADGIRRLILNLVTNAHRHTRQGRIHIHIQPQTHDQKSYIAIHIHDTGAGIPPQILERLGTPFALNTGVIGVGHATGAGLGLAICKAIVAAHDGSMTVASTPGKGTHVQVRLRADLADAADQNPHDLTIATSTRIDPQDEAA